MKTLIESLNSKTLKKFGFLLLININLDFYYKF